MYEGDYVNNAKVRPRSARGACCLSAPADAKRAAADAERELKAQEAETKRAAALAARRAKLQEAQAAAREKAAAAPPPAPSATTTSFNEETFEIKC